MAERVLVTGGTSDIGRAIAWELAGRGKALALAGRDESMLEAIARDIEIRFGTCVTRHAFEATDFHSHGLLVEEVVGLGRLAGVVCCHGILASEDAAAHEFDLCRRMIDVNYTSTVSILQRVAPSLPRGGFVCVISSVAGDRGRQSNFTYGSTKAALNTYLQGLRNRLHKAGVHVTVVKPGFVNTRMTWGLLDPESPLVVEPARVARDVIRGVERQKHVVYSPWFWRPIMAAIRAIPEPIFKRLSL